MARPGSDDAGCCSGTFLLIAAGLAIWAAATPAWFNYYPADVIYGYAVSGPFVLSHVGNWGATVSIGGQVLATSTSWTSWKDAASLLPCSNVTFNNGLTMLGWGIEWGVCDTAGNYLGTPPAILALQALVIITAVFTCFAGVAACFSATADDRALGGVAKKGFAAAAFCTLIALCSSIATFSMVLAAVPWYSDSLRGDQPILPISVLSLTTGTAFLYPLQVPERFRLGAGFGTTVTVTILCLLVLPVLVFSMRSRNESRQPAPSSPQGAEAAAAAAAGSAHGSRVIDPELQPKDTAAKPEAPQDVTVAQPESQPKAKTEMPQEAKMADVAAQAPPAALAQA
jgi:hypothetical protein